MKIIRLETEGTYKDAVIHMKAIGKYNTSNHTRHTWMSTCGKLEPGDKISDSMDIVNCPDCRSLEGW